MQDFSFLQSYAESLVEKGSSIPGLGLWDGKMGIAITLYHLSKLMQQNEYGERANGMIDEIYGDLTSSTSYFFSDGLIGIGCGTEYLISNGFVEGDSDEVLSEIDQEARNIIDYRPTDLKSLKIGKGICGVGCYLYYRLRDKPKNDDSMITLKLKEYLIYLIDWIEELLLEGSEKTVHSNVYFLLCMLHELDVFNFKVEKLAASCLQKMMDDNCHAQDHYELLNIFYLKVLKPWI